MTLFKLKQDLYRTARGGYARFWNIYCFNCKNHLLLYQKDGPGPLKRMYADRIIAPQEFIELPHGPITCQTCHATIATPYTYEKERRPAFLVQEGSLIKKIGKGFYPQE